MPLSPRLLLQADHLRYALAELDPRERQQIIKVLTAEPGPKKVTYPISECMRAARRVAEILNACPDWPQARARATVARELGITTVVLRRMLANVG